MIKLGSCFTGIGAWEKGLKNMGIEYDLQWFFENDKYPATAYCAIHEENINKNKWDITKADVDRLSDIDMLVYSPPCQAFSIAGKQLGTKDPRGQLFYHTMPIIRSKKPKICIMENVKGLVGKKFTDLFKDMLNCLESAGYNNYYKVLNAKDFGIPQNRERVFIVSIRKDVDTGTFNFPIGFDNSLRLKDFLEDKVDEKYYISQEKTEKLISQFKNGKISKINTNPSEKGMNGNVNTSNIANTITTNKGEGQKICIPCITPDRVKKNQNGRRFKENGAPMFTLTSQDRHGILQVGNAGEYSYLYNVGYRIRKLTPKECWRLMGFDDIDYGTGKQALEQTFYKGKDRSNSRMYKMAGNSVVVKTIECIYKKLFKVINL